MDQKSNITSEYLKLLGETLEDIDIRHNFLSWTLKAVGAIANSTSGI